MPVIKMENKYKSDRIETVTKQIIERLKNVIPTNFDHASYRDRGGQPPPHHAFDEPENRPVQEDPDMYININV